MEASADLSIITLGCSCERRCSDCFGYSFDFLFSELDHYFSEMVQMSRARREARNFDKRFWGGADLNKLYESATERRSSIGPQEGIFYSGMTEFLRSRASNLEARAGHLRRH